MANKLFSFRINLSLLTEQHSNLQGIKTVVKCSKKSRIRNKLTISQFT